jgi:hypothetical protein
MNVYSRIKEQENLSFGECSLTTFYRLMKQMGFKLAKVGDISRKILMEKNDVVIKRRAYLREKKQIENNFPHYSWVYLDESFVHKNLVTNQVIICNSELLGLKLQIGKGLRFSIIAAGNKNGFIKNSQKILVNEEINSEIFENWLKNDLLPNLTEKSVILLDNAPTRSRRQSYPYTK